MPKSKPAMKRRNRRPSFQGTHVLVCGAALSNGTICLLTSDHEGTTHVTVAIDDLGQICYGYRYSESPPQETLWQVAQRHPDDPLGQQ